MVKTLRFHCRGRRFRFRFRSLVGERKIPHATGRGQKKKKTVYQSVSLTAVLSTHTECQLHEGRGFSVSLLLFPLRPGLW